MNNPERTNATRRESLSVFVASSAWQDVVKTAEDDIIRPLKAKALTNAELTEREQTGVVRALQAVRKLIELPYQKLADASAKPLDEILPPDIKKLFS